MLLTRQDWRGRGASWGPKGIGYWEVNVVGRGRYDIRLRFDPLKTDGEAAFTCGRTSLRQVVAPGSAECVFSGVELPLGPGRIETRIISGRAEYGVKYVEVRRMEEADAIH